MGFSRVFLSPYFSRWVGILYHPGTSGISLMAAAQALPTQTIPRFWDDSVVVGVMTSQCWFWDSHNIQLGLSPLSFSWHSPQFLHGALEPLQPPPATALLFPPCDRCMLEDF